MDPALRVAIVAASLRILGGQAVQAQRLVDAWEADERVRARGAACDRASPMMTGPS